MRQRRGGKIIGLLAAGLIWKRNLRRVWSDSATMRKLEFGGDTRRIGVRFNEKIRGAFRRSWLKIHS